MNRGSGRYRDWFLMAAGAAALLGSSGASAIPVTGFKGHGFEAAYGSYAPRGDCTREPRITINDAGFSFRANGRTVESRRFEYAASYMGPRYEGISQVFFPFLVSDNDPGPLILTLNHDEKPGVIRLESSRPPNQRLDPFHAALAAGGLYSLCAGTGRAVPAQPAARAPAPVQGTALSWTNLPSLVGRFPGSYDKSNIDLFDAGPVAAAIRTAVGGKLPALKTNLSVVSPLERHGSVYYLSGNAEHKGGEEQAYILIDATRRAVQVGLWERGKLTVHTPQGGRIAPPPDIQKMLNASPPENAVALPGTPWEVVPVQGRAPLAHVFAAGSPNITSFSLFCENGRPMMAVLLNKPSTRPALTVTWNFSGRLINIPVARGNREGTFWQASLAGSPLVSMLLNQKGSAMLRLNGDLEGEASLAAAPTVLRTALRACQRF